MNVNFISSVLLLIGSFILILYTMLHYSFARRAIREQDDRLANDLRNGPLESLLNGSGINNIPKLNLVTSNETIATANKCANGPLFVSAPNTDIDDARCVATCLNSSARSLSVVEGDTVMYENGQLRPGNYCLIGARPECNTNMSVVLMTVNSVVCRSKFPNIVGGPLANNVIACSNRLIYDPQNYLWDYKNNERFDPSRTRLVDENERLADGSFRFRCKFKGVDERGNQYMMNPWDRFHPFKNYCASLIYRAHPDVTTRISADGNDYTCDCGNENETRVRHSVEGDPRSRCSSATMKRETVTGSREKLTLIYNCFTLFSPIEDVADRFPCPENLFTREGNQVAEATIFYSQNDKIAIEHPQYEYLPDGAHVSIRRGYKYF